MNKTPSKKSKPASESDGASSQYKLRHIRSYSKRSGRATAAQRHALAAHWSHYGLDVPAGEDGFNTAFGNTPKHLVLEVGFGNGESLYAQAQTEGDYHFIGVEVYLAGIGALLHRLAADDPGNVRLYHADALDVLKQCVPDQSLERLQLYFPDPWPKKKHHKRRLLQPNRMPLFLRKLKPTGLMAIATDDANYAQAMHEACFANGDNCRIELCGERPKWRLETRFERRGTALGHKIYDFIVRPIRVAH